MGLYPMPKLLVVVGATGQQGRSVIQWFQQNEPSIRIRGLTRSPTSDAATSLASTGVEVIKADLNDFQSLQLAFKGANYIFAYTDTASIIRDSASTGGSTSAVQHVDSSRPATPPLLQHRSPARQERRRRRGRSPRAGAL